MKVTTAKDNMLMHGFILVTILATAKSAEAEITMEAAFQGNLIVHLGPLTATLFYSRTPTPLPSVASFIVNCFFFFRFYFGQFSLMCPLTM